MAAKPVPEGYHAVTPYLVVRGAQKTIEFLEAAFGAKLHFALKRPDGAILHAELTIDDARLMLADESEEHAAMPTMLYLYVVDVDAVYRRALVAGGKAMKEPEDQFFGDRTGSLKDPGGNQWEISTRKETVAPAELQKRADAMFKRQGKAA
jgi:uncharacterized glyoxalase superfamily protein PhnB